MVTPSASHPGFWCVLAAVVLSAGPAEVSLSASSGAGAGVRVAVVFRAKNTHRRAATALKQELNSAGTECILLEMPEGDKARVRSDTVARLVDFDPAVVATGGTKATVLAVEELPGVPVVFFLVPNALDAPFMMEDYPARRRIAGVTTDVSPDRQINWLTALCPGVQRIGILASGRSKITATKMEAVGKEHGVEVRQIEASKDDFMAAIDAIGAQGYDAMLMIPDAAVYNSVTVQRLLLWGLRHKKPVVAFSAHIVKAGALAGLYYDNEAIGVQTARLIRRILGGVDVSSVGLEYPEHVTPAVNQRTADLIGITLDQRRLTPNTVRYGGK